MHAVILIFIITIIIMLTMNKLNVIKIIKRSETGMTVALSNEILSAK